MSSGKPGDALEDAAKNEHAVDKPAGKAESCDKKPAQRQEYETKVRALRTKAEQMKAAAKSPEEMENIARALHAERRALGVEYKELTPPDMLEKIYARNLEKYGDKLGPSVEWLRGRGKSWDQIIESA